MICQNCGAMVDNDLIFCTSCGVRLSVTESQMPTVVMDKSVVTETSLPSRSPKTNSNLKWTALILALIMLPASLIIAYVLLNNSQKISPNTSKPTNSNPVISANRKSNNFSNQSTNISANNSNSIVTNAEPTNQNANITANSNSATEQTEVINERIEIAPSEHIARPFKLDSDAKIIGDTKVLEGEPVEGYVYLQTMFDEHFPDPTYKVFNFEGKYPKVEQTLVKGDYVLVFINKNKSSMIIQAKFSIDKK